MQKKRTKKPFMDVKKKHCYCYAMKINFKVYLWHFLAKQQVIAERIIPVKNAMMTCGCLTISNNILTSSGMERNKLGIEIKQWSRVGEVFQLSTLTLLFYLIYYDGEVCFCFPNLIPAGTLDSGVVAIFYRYSKVAVDSVV